MKIKQFIMYGLCSWFIIPSLNAMEEKPSNALLSIEKEENIEQMIVRTRKLHPQTLTPILGTSFELLDSTSDKNDIWEYIQKKKLTRSEEIVTCCCGWLCLAGCYIYFSGFCQCHNDTEGCSGNEWINPSSGQTCVDATFEDMIRALFNNIVNR